MTVRKFMPKKYPKNIAINFANWISQNFWFQSSNDLWYFKTDGNPSEGIKTEDLFELFNKDNYIK